MTRTAFDATKEPAKGFFGNTTDPSPLLCSQCRTLTDPEKLAKIGDRCGRCFEGYCDAGIRGGAKGFLGGASDTPLMAEMRKRLKGRRPVGQAMAESEDDAREREAAKQRTARRVAEYKRERGLA